MNIAIEEITLLIDCSGADELYLKAADLPEGTWPWESKAAFKMLIASGQGEEYCEKHFPDVPTKIISMKRGVIQDIPVESK